MGKAKARMHEITNPETPAPESKEQRRAREKREKQLRDAMFAHTSEQLAMRHDRAPRHHVYDDERRKGDRKQRDENAIRDASED